MFATDQQGCRSGMRFHQKMMLPYAVLLGYLSAAIAQDVNVQRQNEALMAMPMPTQAAGQGNAAMASLPILAAPAAPVWSYGKETFPSDIKTILSLPDDQIDAGVAAITFAKEIYPNIDKEAYIARFNDEVNVAKTTIDQFGKYDPISIIQALNTYFHFKFAAKYDLSPNGRNNKDNYFLTGMMDRHMGQCMTMPMFYMAIAQRLGYPVFTVQAPEHTFVRYVDPRLPGGFQNIEVSGQGITLLSDAGYIHWLNINQQGIKSGAYLRTLTRRQWLGILLLQNGVVFSHEGRDDRAILYFKKAHELDPQDPYYPKNLATEYHTKSKQAKTPATADRFLTMSQQQFELAYEMGWVHDPDALTREDALVRGTK